MGREVISAEKSEVAARAGDAWGRGRVGAGAGSRYLVPGARTSGMRPSAAAAASWAPGLAGGDLFANHDMSMFVNCQALSQKTKRLRWTARGRTWTMFSENIINVNCCTIIKMPASREDKFSAGMT